MFQVIFIEKILRIHLACLYSILCKFLDVHLKKCGNIVYLYKLHDNTSEQYEDGLDLHQVSLM